VQCGTTAETNNLSRALTSAGDDMTPPNVTLSDAAAKRISEIIASDAGKQALRVSVEGGGCSGFSYKFDLAEAPAADDVVIANGDAKVLIDSLSLVYMEGSEIDFVDNLLGQSFQIKNPNAVASCGCGTSFSI
jgi:iron-sulfur cluster assembly accessory protein